MDMAEGVVKWFDEVKGYGFITVAAPWRSGTVRLTHQEVFVHYSAIQARHQVLDAGEYVSFAVEPGQHGPQAVHVTQLGDSTKVLPAWSERRQIVLAVLMMALAVALAAGTLAWIVLIIVR